MKSRYKASRYSKKRFTRTAKKVNKRNYTTPMRGGYRF